MYLQMVSLVVNQLIGRLTKLGLEEQVFQKLASSIKGILHEYLCFSVFKIGLIGLLADLVLATNLGAGGKIRFSEFAYVAVATMMIGITMGLFSRYFHRRAVAAPLKDLAAEPIREVAIEVLLIARKMLEQAEQDLATERELNLQENLRNLKNT